jgi:hypothetical protein
MFGARIFHAEMLTFALNNKLVAAIRVSQAFTAWMLKGQAKLAE